ADVDGNVESRMGTVSAFNGPEPEIEITQSPEDEVRVISSWLSARTKDGIKPEEIGVFVRSDAELPRARAAVARAGMKAVELDGTSDTMHGAVSISTMHLAKGLEFRAVVVAACDDEIVPLQTRITAVTDDSDLEEVYNTERHLLYVACTRARDSLLITGVDPASEFLDDLRRS
ncbi:MAG: DNA helicase, partial [Planctomycetes bacterium]|nr:DNA helicase [Planctomycetota bacterium]